VPYSRIKYLPIIKKIPDELWNEIKLMLPPEEPNDTIGRPAIPFRRVLDGMFCVHFKNWLSMEDAAKRLWIRIYVP
jgi:hypothetical protein